MSRPVALLLPDLDAIDALAPEQLAPTLAHLAALQARIAARLAAASTQSRWRTVAWAAEQTDLSAHFFYERASADHPDALPFLKRRGRTIRVDEAGFQRWLRSRG